MASALTILLILAAAGSLIAWLDWISRNIDEALDEAVGKENPDTGSRGGGRNKRHQGLGTQTTHPSHKDEAAQ